MTLDESQPLLAVEDLSVAFRSREGETRAVDGIGFTIRRGETVALVGESGSGKSVTALAILRLLDGAARQDGRILFKGRDLASLPERAMRDVRGADITMVFQEPMTSLNPLHTIERQIGEVLGLHRGLTGKAAKRRILELLDLVGLRDAESRMGAYPHELSGGQRQRVMIAIGLSCRRSPASRTCSSPTSRRRRSTSPSRRRSWRCSPTYRSGSAWRCCSSPTISASWSGSPTGSA